MGIMLAMIGDEQVFKPLHLYEIIDIHKFKSTYHYDDIILLIINQISISLF